MDLLRKLEILDKIYTVEIINAQESTKTTINIDEEKIRIKIKS